MTQPAPTPWTVEAFFAWQEQQSERYELVGGHPLRMMAGARNVHDDIVVNILGELRNRLRGGPGRVFTSDGSIETVPSQIRRPDLGVDCGRRDPNALKAASPRLVVEVLSPSTRDFDTIEKLAEYRGVVGLEQIMVVEPNAPDVVLWSRRGGEEWRRDAITGLDSEVHLPGIGVMLALRDIYEGVEFPARLCLVAPDTANLASSGREGA